MRVSTSEPFTPNACQEHGFTLIEAMVVVAIVAVLAALASPSFTAMLQRYRVDSTYESLNNAIQLARIEAIRTGRRVNLETAVCGGVADWDCGWVMYADINSDDGQDADEPTIREFDAPDNVHIVNSHATNPLRLDIGRTGFFLAGGSNTTFNIGPRGVAASASCKALVINVAMRVRADTGAAHCPP